MATKISTVTSKSDLAGFIEAARAAGYEALFNRELAAQAVAAECAAEEAERRAKEWEPALAAIRKAMPEWAHEFIEAPTEDLYGDESYNPVAICVPTCTTISAYSNGKLVIFDALEPVIDRDEDTGLLSVRRHSRVGMCEQYDLGRGEHDFNVAVLKATQFAEAERRMLTQVIEANAKQQHCAPASKEAKIETPRDPAAKVLASIAELNLRSSAPFEQGLLYGLIMVAAEVRAVAVAVEDLTTALTTETEDDEDASL